jgi:2-methylcitrate dehydratase PrpD
VVLSLVPKVELLVDKEFDDRFPTRRGARVTIDDTLAANLWELPSVRDVRNLLPR